MALVLSAPYPSGGGGTRLWTPNDLPGKLAWYHFPDSARVTLDANGKIASIENKFDNGSNPASTVRADRRHSITQVNGYDVAHSTDFLDGILVSNISAFPRGNADRFMLFVTKGTGSGTMGGYLHQNGGSNYWIDSDFYLNGTGSSLAGTADRTSLHVLTANHSNGVSTLRNDGVQVAQGTVNIAGNIPTYENVGVKGVAQDFYTYIGDTLAALFLDRALSADDSYRLEWWYAAFTGKTLPADNPYKSAAPTVPA